MATTTDRIQRRVTHPFPARLLAGAVPLFLGALLGDYAYWSTYQVEWSNFASWLIVGALVFAGGALVFAIIDLVRAERREAHSFAYAFVGEHASWNRSPPVGYKVVSVPFRKGRPAGDPVDFVSGFLGDDGKTRGGPVGVTVDPRGALIVADDLSNTLWRVTPAR